jgi:hypothetical protein
MHLVTSRMFNLITVQSPKTKCPILPAGRYSGMQGIPFAS